MATKRKPRKPALKKAEPTANHDDGFIEEAIEIFGPTGWDEERAKQLRLGTPKTVGQLASAVEQVESHEREASRLTQERDETRRRSGRPFDRNDDVCDHLHKRAVDASAYASAYRFVAESAEGFQTIRSYLDNAEVTAANIRKLSIDISRRDGLEWRDVWVRMPIGEFVGRLCGKPPAVLSGQLPQAEAATACYLGDGKIKIGNAEPFTVTPLQTKVIEYLVRVRSATHDQLKAACNTDEPHKVIKRIHEAHPETKPFLKRPGGPGKGNYSTTIVDRRPQNAHRPPENRQDCGFPPS